MPDEKAETRDAQLNALIKRAGRAIEMRPEWDSEKLEIMERLVLAKFSQSQDLSQRLRDTEDEELNEGNYWGDTFWGMCRGRGQNHL